MNQKSSFPQQAAYFCLGAPFLGDFVLTLTKESFNKSQSSQIIVTVILSALLLSGFGLGVYSLFKSNGVKKIIIPATIGIILHLVTGYIAYASYNKAGVNYFEIRYTLKNPDNTTYDQQIIGSSAKSLKVIDVIDHITTKVKSGCPGCMIIRAEQINNLPADLVGIFEGKPVKYTYTTMEVPNGPPIKTRNIFPTKNPQPSCNDAAMIDYVNRQTELSKGSAIITCVDAIK